MCFVTYLRWWICIGFINYFISLHFHHFQLNDKYLIEIVLLVASRFLNVLFVFVSPHNLFLCQVSIVQYLWWFRWNSKKKKWLTMRNCVGGRVLNDWMMMMRRYFYFNSLNKFIIICWIYWIIASSIDFFFSLFCNDLNFHFISR